MQQNTQLSIDALLGRLDQVRQLARTLVRDAAEADEVVAVALENAFRRPVPVGPEPTGWIRTVLLNVVRDRVRSDGRRERREEQAARREALPDTAETAANLERDREVLEEVLALEEPFRGAILLHHFEGLKTREIAERTGSTPAAVQKQLQRGREQLRKRLESRYGGEGAWAVALLPLCEGTVAVRGAALVGAGSVLRWGLLALALLLLGVGFGGAALWPAEPETSSVESVELAGAIAEPVEDRSTEPIAPAESSVREVAAGSVAVERSVGVPAAAPASMERAVRLVDLEARPLAGAELRWTVTGVRIQEVERDAAGNPVGWTSWDSGPEDFVVRTDADGRTRVDERTLRSLGGEVVEHAGREWTQVFALIDVAGEEVLVWAESVEVAGRTVDEWGQPLGGVRLRVDCSLSGLSGFDLEVQQGGFHSFDLGESAEDGSFGPVRVPFHPELMLSAGRSSYSFVLVPVPEGGRGDLEIQLPAVPERAEPRIVGRVLESDGVPVAEAWVRFGQNTAQTDDRGRFEMEISLWATGRSIVARAEDGRFASVEAPDRERAVEAAEDQPVEIRLPASMPPLRARLVDRDGRSMKGWLVHLLDGTQMGTSDQMHEFVPGDVSAHGFATDAAGVFEVPRMDDRDYVVLVRSPEDWMLYRFEGVRGGPELQELRLPELEVVEDLRGVVVSSSGSPVPNARVWLGTPTFQGQAMSTSAQGEEQRADADGRFSFGRVGWRHLVVSAIQPDGEGDWAKLELTEAPSGPVEVTLELSGWVRLRVADESERSWVEFRDGAGEALSVESHWPNLRSAARRHHQNGYGRLGRMLVPDAAVEVVLGEGERELRRTAVSIRPGEEVLVDL